MKAKVVGLVAVLVLVLVSASAAWAQPGGCLDDPDYYCFARCDYFWDFCVSGSHGCYMIWLWDICADNFQHNQCCVHTINEGLF